MHAINDTPGLIYSPYTPQRLYMTQAHMSHVRIRTSVKNHEFVGIKDNISNNEQSMTIRPCRLDSN
jgi:hypothetical protein